MSQLLEYKGYYGSADFSVEDEIFYGKLLYIRALVSYEADSAKQLISAFHEAVDDYLDMCRVNDLTPERPFKGSFNVRVDRNLHRKAAMAAANHGMSLNRFVESAIEKAVEA
jgi:predicted HicB family RNase H-like nuclease